MAGIYQVTLNTHDGQGNVAQNVLHYSLDELGGGGTMDYLQQLSLAWTGTLSGQFQGLFAADSFWATIDLKKIFPTGSYTRSDAVEMNGTLGATSLANCLGGLMEWFPIDGWAHTAKMFAPAAPIAMVLDGVVQAAYETALNLFALDLLTPLALGGGFGTATFGVWSKKTHLFHDCGSFNTKANVSSLSKRLRP